MNPENIIIKRVKDNIDKLFEKNLSDMIRGIRNNKENESKFITQCLDEIKNELRQDNMTVKAMAIAKLIYLNMIGYNIHWAAFNIIEVMSSVKFVHKRIAYLAAAQSFHDKLDVLMLATNIIKKDINSHNQYESGMALSGLSCFVTCDLARDLCTDVIALMSSTKPYVRKRAILMMYKIFLQYPECLESAFNKMREKLEDSDQSVQSAAVNVICEMAKRNPANYIGLSPLFFKLMTHSTNNWMLIKIIKLFGNLTPIEPRLGKKLLEPLTNLIHSTSAMSLLYECINTLLSVLVSISNGDSSIDHSASIQLCLQKLRILIEDNDQNLKYLGLLAMGKILKCYPKSVQAHKDIVLSCLTEHKDDSIRRRALHLLYGMVTKKNLMEMVKTLLAHLDQKLVPNKINNNNNNMNNETTDIFVNPNINININNENSNFNVSLNNMNTNNKNVGFTEEFSQAYRDDLIRNIIDVCRQNNYQYISDFEWYFNVLLEFGHCNTPANTDLIGEQWLDLTIRVPTLRTYAVSKLERLLLENCISSLDMKRTNLANTKRPQTVMPKLLMTIAYICGEYSQHLNKPLECINAMIHQGDVSQQKYCLNKQNISSQKKFDKNSNVLCQIQSMFLSAALKILIKEWERIYPLLANNQEEQWFASMEKCLHSFYTMSDSVEIQDRAFFFSHLLMQIKHRHQHGENNEKNNNSAKFNNSLLFGEDLGMENTESQNLSLFVKEKLSNLFTNMTLNPVGPKAQTKLQVPENLDLETPFNSQFLQSAMMPFSAKKISTTKNFHADHNKNNHRHKNNRRRSNHQTKNVLESNSSDNAVNSDSVSDSNSYVSGTETSLNHKNYDDNKSCSLQNNNLVLSFFPYTDDGGDHENMMDSIHKNSGRFDENRYTNKDRSSKNAKQQIREQKKARELAILNNPHYLKSNNTHHHHLNEQIAGDSLSKTVSKTSKKKQNYLHQSEQINGSFNGDVNDIDNNNTFAHEENSRPIKSKASSKHTEDHNKFQHKVMIFDDENPEESTQHHSNHHGNHIKSSKLKPKTLAQNQRNVVDKYLLLDFDGADLNGEPIGQNSDTIEPSLNESLEIKTEMRSLEKSEHKSVHLILDKRCAKLNVSKLTPPTLKYVWEPPLNSALKDMKQNYDYPIQLTISFEKCDDKVQDVKLCFEPKTKKKTEMLFLYKFMTMSQFDSAHGEINLMPFLTHDSNNLCQENDNYNGVTEKKLQIILDLANIFNIPTTDDKFIITLPFQFTMTSIEAGDQTVIFNSAFQLLPSDILLTTHQIILSDEKLQGKKTAELSEHLVEKMHTSFHLLTQKFAFKVSLVGPSYLHSKNANTAFTHYIECLCKTPYFIEVNHVSTQSCLLYSQTIWGKPVYTLFKTLTPKSSKNLKVENGYDTNEVWIKIQVKYCETEITNRCIENLCQNAAKN